MWKWILATLGIFNLGYGAFLFPWSLSGQKAVTWGSLVPLFNLIVGTMIIAGLLGWYSRDVADFLG